MLSSLSIKNYLLIDNLYLNFDDGFSVITGETGAGKSIILGAISLLLGKRADSDILTPNNSKCIIEGTFSIKNLKLKDIFESFNLDYDDNTIIRREILKEGKSRAFINDTPVKLNALKTITEKFIDLHTQHENLALASSKYRLQIVDISANTKELQQRYTTIFSKYKTANKELQNTNNELIAAKKDLDYYQFQAEQLTNAYLDDNNELNQLEEQSLMLENAEEIKLNLQNTINIFDGNEISIDTLLSEIKSNLNKIASSYKQAEETISRLDSVIIETRDIAAILEDDIEKAEINPELLDTTNSRIDTLNTLLNKHNSANILELKEKLEHYRSYIQGTEEIEVRIKQLKSEADKLSNESNKLAKNLSKERKKAFPKIEQNITNILKQLGMADAIFKIENTISDELNENGFDSIKFLFTANKSIPAQNLDKVASGGEFSRLMLALKSLLAETTSVPTIIFDEIDTGVSGEIASKMGKIMKQISLNFQVISITHLPQVAAIGTYHYKVYKETSKTSTVTKITKLNDTERINEIASMISGEQMTTQAIENAKALLVEKE